MACAFQFIRSGRCFVAIIALAICAPAFGATPALRIVTYNIQADTEGFTGPRPGLYTVLEGIGEQNRNGVWQPLDILALEETTSNTASVTPIVTALNNYYGVAGLYALVAFQATQNGSPSSGNGPNALLYNTATLQLLLQNGAEAVGVPGTPSGTGAPRQVPRYKFQPVGGTAEDIFYVYVTHMKSGDANDGDNGLRRNREAQLIRADAATLPAASSILYVGDFNINSATEAAYTTLTASGQGQGIDPFLWTNPTPANLMSWASTGIRYRDDIQFMTTNVASNAPVAGLHHLNGSCRVFGNNGSVPVGGSVNSQSNTALNDLVGPISASSVRSALTTASDHLPIVADYLVITPYQAWREQNFTAAELNDPAVSGDFADPDRDAMPNLMEYGLALDPNTPDAQGLPKPGKTVVGSIKYMTLTYTKPKVSSDLIYTVEVSNNLSTWFSGSNYTAIVSITDNPGGLTQTVVVRDRTPMANQLSRYLRLGVTN